PRAGGPVRGGERGWSRVKVGGRPGAGGPRRPGRGTRTRAGWLVPTWARQYGGGEPGEAADDRRDQPVRVRVGPGVSKAQYDAVKGLVVQVEGFAARPGDLPAPVDRGGVRQQREPKSYRDRESQRPDRPRR